MAVVGLMHDIVVQTDAVVAQILHADYTNAEFAEIIAHVALNAFSNYRNPPSGVDRVTQAVRHEQAQGSAPTDDGF